MSKGTLQIHSQNILPIIKKWLYSDHDIFIRELVSNSCDAIQKVKVLRDKGEVDALDADFRIDVTIDKEKKTLTFTDNGIGMDKEEVEKYIAQIAFSGAEEFVQKYQTHNEKDQYIGHFGLGFYSAYMVSDKVEIETLSYKPGAEPVFWSCDGSSEYEIDKGHRQTRGTEITLFINKDSEDYLDENNVKKILTHYCAFLPYPIFLNGQQINTQTPLWVKAPSECQESDYLDFYHYLYPGEEDPLFWVHLNVDYPFHLKGILYFPKIRKDFDPRKTTVRLFCNRVFVSGDCKDVIPDYLMVLRGVIDSPDIPLNVSRSYLQMDRTVRQLGSHISKKVSDSLNALYKSDREKYIQCWEDVSPIVKIGAVQDEKFYEKVKDILIWQTTEGQWTTISEYLERNGEKTKNKIFYTIESGHFPVISLFKKKEIEVIASKDPVDPWVINTLESKIAPATFQRIDSSIEDYFLDEAREKQVLDDQGKTEGTRLAEFIKSSIDDSKLEVEAKSLADDTLPVFIVIDENQRRFREYMAAMDPKGNLKGFEQKKLIVNTNSPLMTAIHQLESHQPDLAKDMAKEVYELALLSQKEMDRNALSGFISRTNHVLEKLAVLATQRNA